jgi:hypothetical protein
MMGSLEKWLKDESVVSHINFACNKGFVKDNAAASTNNAIRKRRSRARQTIQKWQNAKTMTRFEANHLLSVCRNVLRDCNLLEIAERASNQQQCIQKSSSSPATSVSLGYQAGFSVSDQVGVRSQSDFTCAAESASMSSVLSDPMCPVSMIEDDSTCTINPAVSTAESDGSPASQLPEQELDGDFSTLLESIYAESGCHESTTSADLEFIDILRHWVCFTQTTDADINRLLKLLHAHKPTIGGEEVKWETLPKSATTLLKVTFLYIL